MAKSLATPVAIERGKSYPLKEFLRLTGWSNEALRNRRDEGFRVVYLGREAWVSGDDFNDFIADKSRSTDRWPAASVKRRKSRSSAR